MFTNGEDEHESNVENNLDNIPVIDSEEALAKLLGKKPDAAQGGDGKVKKVEKPAAAAGGEGEEEEEEEEEEDEGEGITGKKKKDGEEGGGKEGDDDNKTYLTNLHYLNSKYELNLNLKDDEPITAEEEREGIESVIDGMVNGVNKALKDYQHIDKLMKDPEVEMVIKAKAEGKTLKDIFSQYAQTTDGQTDDELVTNDLKKKYPKSDDADHVAMIKSLKDSGKFANFVKGLREQSLEEQSSNIQKAEELRKQQAIEAEKADVEEIKKFTGYVKGIPKVYGVPLTEEWKDQIIAATTERDEEGKTYLDHVLQSDEGTVLAALGILYMKELIGNAASLQGNRKTARFVDKLHQTPDKLQSSSNQKERTNELDMNAVNSY